MHLLKLLAEERRNLGEDAMPFTQDGPIGNAAAGAKEEPSRFDTSKKDPSRTMENLMLDRLSAIAKSGADRGHFKELVRACIMYDVAPLLNELIASLGEMTPGKYRTVARRFQNVQGMAPSSPTPAPAPAKFGVNAPMPS